MQNYLFLLYCVVCFLLVKYVIYKMRVRDRKQKSEHPLVQAQKFYDRLDSQSRVTKLLQFPIRIKQHLTEMKDRENTIQMVAILLGMLQIHGDKALSIKALESLMNTNLSGGPAISVQYIKEQLKQYDLGAYYNRQV